MKEGRWGCEFEALTKIRNRLFHESDSSLKQYQSPIWQDWNLGLVKFVENWRVARRAGSAGDS